ncbi:hypothetical protein ANCCAN_05356 [Ancylostoma caninum]|uniref:Peptidase M12A domain-containing protein n=1 Tax=Ancylostoma caninum TaxID=29170 RepID=A0A368GW05_ANCCA|nr:hypothetical protein ANCCAN_05356 [Ancylostoma caninum]
MRFTVTCFLFAACLSVAVLGNIEDDKVRHRFSRHKRQAKRRKDGVRPSRTINYDFHDTISKSEMILFLKTALAWEKDTCVKFNWTKSGISFS